MLPSEEKGIDQVELTVRGDDVSVGAADSADETSRLVSASSDSGVQKKDETHSGAPPWWTYAVLVAAVSTIACKLTQLGIKAHY